MALREVTVEINATYVVKVKASNSKEAIKKAEDLVLHGTPPNYMDGIILDVQPIATEDL